MENSNWGEAYRTAALFGMLSDCDWLRGSRFKGATVRPGNDRASYNKALANESTNVRMAWASCGLFADAFMMVFIGVMVQSPGAADWGVSSCAAAAAAANNGRKAETVHGRLSGNVKSYQKHQSSPFRDHIPGVPLKCN